MPGYRPPRQTVRGQLLDATTILVLIFGTLFVTTYLIQGSEADTGAGVGETRKLEELPITAAEREQFRKMIDSGTVDLQAVNSAVEANRATSDKYDFSVAALLGTAVLLAGYLAFVYRASFREYREVIEEKFGARDGGASS